VRAERVTRYAERENRRINSTQKIMNKMISMMVIAIAMLFSSINMSAQSNNQQRLSREELAEKQARHIAHELALDDATTQKYVATYCAYQKEVWALGPRVKRHSSANATEAEAEQANKARMEQSQKILDLREKYYKEYSKFLTQKQIERAYELEQQVMRRLVRHHRQGAGAMKHRRPRTTR
jgi:type II secretory pathway pseudopilin PulG